MTSVITNKLVALQVLTVPPMQSSPLQGGPPLLYSALQGHSKPALADPLGGHHPSLLSSFYRRSPIGSSPPLEVPQVVPQLQPLAMGCPGPITCSHSHVSFVQPVPPLQKAVL
ncbi:hypothetical protein GOP47_0003316 [Adiantum capillus-veneris]|uniref:Uncharacterized protein n=1 Tax=Adiantum capillus-veneris TaxID=13818 RepID=A0A9D4ZQ12_ADICA|nr:hypothetical protein GOP47_0003316 [Adiantum capillus-veneris]